MRRLLTVFVLFALLQLVFAVGVVVGISLRPTSPSFHPDRKELKCTCVPCLPDLFCMKCGHKSRDCPKLAHIFKKGTNAVNAVSAPVK